MVFIDELSSETRRHLASQWHGSETHGMECLGPVPSSSQSHNLYFSRVEQGVCKDIVCNPTVLCACACCSVARCATVCLFSANLAMWDAFAKGVTACRKYSKMCCKGNFCSVHLLTHDLTQVVITLYLPKILNRQIPVTFCYSVCPDYCFAQVTQGRGCISETYLNIQCAHRVLLISQNV